MRFRLLRRRLTISAPRMTVRSTVPWTMRWLLAAVVLGFCAAVGLWAFEMGKGLAGLQGHSREEVTRLRAEVERLRSERDQAQSVANTSGSLLVTEKAAQEHLITRLKQLEADNQSLRADLGFFEKLIPSNGSGGIAIRSLQGETVGSAEAGAQLHWQVLVIQPVKNAPEFKGKLELTFAGLEDGQPWSLRLPEGALPLQLRQYQRLEGVLPLPPNVVVKSISARVTEGSTTRAVQTATLSR